MALPEERESHSVRDLIVLKKNNRKKKAIEKLVPKLLLLTAIVSVFNDDRYLVYAVNRDIYVFSKSFSIQIFNRRYMVSLFKPGEYTSSRLFQERYG